jgi:hypothetical protein
MLNAFCRVAPSVRFNFLAILAAGVFLRAMVFSSRTSVEVHARRFFDFLGINPPYQIGSWYPLAGAEEIGTDRFSIMSSWSKMAADTAGKLRKGIVRSFLAIYRLGSNCNFQTVPPRFFDGSTVLCVLVWLRFDRIYQKDRRWSAVSDGRAALQRL